MTQAQYMTTVQKAQEASTGFVQSCSDAVETALSASARVLRPVDPAAGVDQLFEFLDESLQAQHETAKRLVGIGASLGDKVRGQAEQVGGAVFEQTEQAKGALRKQAAWARQAAHEQVVHAYEELNKPWLQDELADRDLAETGNVDGLRERLVADDE